MSMVDTYRNFFWRHFSTAVLIIWSLFGIVFFRSLSIGQLLLAAMFVLGSINMTKDYMVTLGKRPDLMRLFIAGGVLMLGGYIFYQEFLYLRNATAIPDIWELFRSDELSFVQWLSATMVFPNIAYIWSDVDTTKKIRKNCKVT